TPIRCKPETTKVSYSSALRMLAFMASTSPSAAVVDKAEFEADNLRPRHLPAPPAPSAQEPAEAPTRRPDDGPVPALRAQPGPGRQPLAQPRVGFLQAIDQPTQVVQTHGSLQRARIAAANPRGSDSASSTTSSTRSSPRK